MFCLWWHISTVRSVIHRYHVFTMSCFYCCLCLNQEFHECIEFFIWFNIYMSDHSNLLRITQHTNWLGSWVTLDFRWLRHWNRWSISASTYRTIPTYVLEIHYTTKKYKKSMIFKAVITHLNTFGLSVDHMAFTIIRVQYIERYSCHLMCNIVAYSYIIIVKLRARNCIYISKQGPIDQIPSNDT